MLYTYNPNTYNILKMTEKNLDWNNLLTLQLKYRESIEKLFVNKYSFQDVDQILENKNIHAELDFDKEYNFYHKFSKLNSHYLYLRNNYHIENLTEEEIGYIESCILDECYLSNEFIMQTCLRVLMEENTNLINFNYDKKEDYVPSKSIVFEFSYDLNKCKSIEELETINKIYEEEIEKIKVAFSKFLNIPISFIVYNGNPDVFKNQTI